MITRRKRAQDSSDLGAKLRNQLNGTQMKPRGGSEDGVLCAWGMKVIEDTALVWMEGEWPLGGVRKGEFVL